VKGGVYVSALNGSSAQRTAACLLEGDETGRVGGTNTRTRVSNRGIGDGELTEVTANHLGLHLDGDEGLTVVNTDDGTRHLGDDDHTAEVGLHHGGLLTNLGGLLCLTEALHERALLCSELTAEDTALAASQKVDHLVTGKSHHLLNGQSTVVVDLELTPLLELSNTLGLGGTDLLLGGHRSN